MWKHTPPLLAVLTAVWMRQWYAVCIAWWRWSRALLEATGRRHWASICSVSPRWPPGSQAKKQQWNIHLICWQSWWPWWCAGTIPHALPDRGGSGLQRKPLDAAIGQVFAPIGAIRHGYIIFCVFSWSTCEEKAWGYVKAPINNRGMTYQWDWTDLRKMIRHFIGGG